MITRREFLTASSGSLIVAAVGSRNAAAAERPWYATMRRCGQLNLNERDPLSLAVAGWIDYWSSLKLDALLLNGGGIVRFYSTDVRYHQSSELPVPRELFDPLAAVAEPRLMRLPAGMECRYSD